MEDNTPFDWAENLDGLEAIFPNSMENENLHPKQDSTDTIAPPTSQVVVLQPQLAGPITITIKTQIQTNRRSNFYLDAAWPEIMLQKAFPIFYYPPIDQNIHQQLSNIDDPRSVWLSEMLHFYYGTSTYLEVQFWYKTQSGKLQLISNCNSHSSVLKLPGQPYHSKVISHEEVKWARNSMVFGVNFNCTRSCFKSEIYVFVRARCGHLYLESEMIELPFRRSEKRKSETVDVDNFTASKRQLLQSIPNFSENPRTNALPLLPSQNLPPMIFAHSLQDLWHLAASSSPQLSFSTTASPQRVSQWDNFTEFF